VTGLIEAPPLTSFMVVVIQVNRSLSQFLRYRTGRINTWGLVMLVVLWLWFVLLSLPGLRQFMIHGL
jgi:hypothetical protein